jgi:hypothetical protein
MPTTTNSLPSVARTVRTPVTFVAVVGAILVSGLAGCRNTAPTRVGERDVVAIHRGNTLTADVPGPVNVMSFVAAAEETFRARGYSIRESDSTADSGYLVAIPPRTNDLPRMVVRARPQGSGIRTSFSYQPFGDEELGRTSLDAILKRLGM